MEETGRQILESGLVGKLGVPDLTLLPGSGGPMPPASERFLPSVTDIFCGFPFYREGRDKPEAEPVVLISTQYRKVSMISAVDVRRDFVAPVLSANRVVVN